ncbi:aldo/keto reductase [Salegentibacter sp. F188]|uniref:Aldo/keto reductase n=1 Tax=Autumnicola patrickiae TaxID=3075591 RepID=A0ABU3DX70_9FLAO|nr:aldo/keto reductase [Salegentibacter sp. F188]MDT0688325.1 aldo/keto reductase [Salegentibacter sp. F188]
MHITNIEGTTKLSNGVKMPCLGLGVYKAKDGDEVINAIHAALEVGYRLIDTASMYKNEEGVGEAIRSSGIPREEIFVTSKVWNDDEGYENTLNAFEESLKKLQFDYLDLYLIHWPTSKYLETWKAIEKLYRDGRVKAIGVCNCMKHHMEGIKNTSEIVPMVLQNEFHPKLVQQSLIDYCGKNNIRYQAWSPLMRGKILETEELMHLAKKYDKTVSQMVIRWSLQKGVMTIPKSVHKERIFENSQVFNFEISAEDMERIDSLDSQERTGAHPDNFMEHFAEKQKNKK